MIEPIFTLEQMSVTSGSPSVYKLRSEGSGKSVHVHFCDQCGTKLYLTFERFADACGIYAGTFDDPNWFAIGPSNSKQIFVDVARPDSILMPNINVFGQHATTNDGAPLPPAVFHEPRIVGQLG